MFADPGAVNVSCTHSVQHVYATPIIVDPSCNPLHLNFAVYNLRIELNLTIWTRSRIFNCLDEIQLAQKSTTYL